MSVSCWPDYHHNLASARLAAANILRVTHGLDVTENNDEFISHVDEAVRITARAGMPGAYTVNVIPARECCSRGVSYT